MNIKNKDTNLKKKSGFTIIELIVVVSIVLVLMSLVTVSATSIIKRSKRLQTQATAQNLKNAILAYYTEYRRYPIISNNSKLDLTLRSNHQLMDVLLGSDRSASENGLNKRRISFFKDKQAKKIKNGKYKSGVNLDNDGGGELWDTYGNYYYIRFDTNYNNRVTKPSWDRSSDSNVVSGSVIVWSSGPDGEESSAKDNITTWK